MLKKFLKIFVMFGLASLNMIFCNYAFAHGTGYRQSELKAVALEFLYSTGEMMSYREAKVYSPVDDKFAVQTGRTDENGRFAFVPDRAGEWRVVVTDEMGHRAEAKINISSSTPDGLNISSSTLRHTVPKDGLNITEFLDNKNSENKNKLENKKLNNLISGHEIYFRAALGVSLLFNIAAFILLRRRERPEMREMREMSEIREGAAE